MKCPVHKLVAVEAVGKCESRVVCGICKLRGKVCFGTFPLNVFSTALICFLVSGVKSFRSVEAVGKCESRVVCGICKLRGKVCFGTFPLNVFSTALICFLVRGVKSFPCAL